MAAIDLPQTGRGRKRTTVDLSQLQKGFADLGAEVRLRAGKRAASSGALAVKKKVRQNIIDRQLVDTQDMLKNVAIANIKATQPGVYQFDVGVRHGSVKQRKTGNDPFYFWFQELGYTNRAGVKVPGKRFITDAIADGGTQKQAVANIIKSLQRSVKKWTT